ncbi:MAG: hypothetical protein WC822_02490 [Candidatus Paceibacterota bacterium]|jgi:hypothetical protein
MRKAITRKDLESVLARLENLLPERYNPLYLERWAPGDGFTRWRLVDAKQRNPLGSRWHSARELYECMCFAAEALYHEHCGNQ